MFLLQYINIYVIYYRYDPSSEHKVSSVPGPAAYIARRLFVWAPTAQAKATLWCQHCPEKRILKRKGFYGTGRVVVGIKSCYLMVTTYHQCELPPPIQPGHTPCFSIWSHMWGQSLWPSSHTAAHVTRKASTCWGIAMLATPPRLCTSKYTALSFLVIVQCHCVFTVSGV